MTIGVIGVILAIALPILMSARSSAGQVKSLSNLRQIGIVFGQYAEAHQDAYPAVEPEKTYRISIRGDLLASFSGPPARWVTAHRWPAVVRETLDIEDHAPVWISPGVDEDARLQPDIDFRTSYHYSHSFVARPELWDLEVEPDPSMLADVRTGEVAQPARKVILWDQELAYLTERSRRAPGEDRAPRPMLFADIHAEPKNAIKATPPVVNRLNTDDSREDRLHNTPQGVLGFDY